MARTPKPMAPRPLLEELLVRQQMLIKQHVKALGGRLHSAPDVL